MQWHFLTSRSSCGYLIVVGGAYAVLINHEKKFIFIHIWKTGGTSIRAALKSLPGTENLDDRANKHLSAIEVRQMVGERLFNEYTSFAVLRNPWDLQVSNFFYARQRPNHYFHDFMMRFSTFEEYLEWRCADGCIPQHTMVTDEDGNLIVKRLLDFEHLEDGFASLCSDFGINARLEQLNSSQHQEYRNYYSDRGRDLVGKAFARDLELFGYSWK